MMPLSPRYLPLITQKRSQSEKKLKKKISFTPTPAGPRKEIFSPPPPLLVGVFGETIKSPSLALSPRVQGFEARLEFFESFRNLPKSTQRNVYQNIDSTPNQAYLEEIQKSHLNPKPFGMLNNQGPESRIDLHCFSMGDTYAHAFSEGLKHFKTLESLNLRSNRLSEKGAYQILSNLEFHPVRYLALSDNILGERSLECILSILRCQKPYLKHLNLENTRITTTMVQSLASVLSTNQSLVYLSLAKNNLQTRSCKALKEMLHYNEKLTKLDLHWNCLRGEGAVMIFEGICDNTSLEELDLSWNAIGNNKDITIFSRISESVSKQTFLLHLDLSHNYITYKECEVLGTGLEQNHTLMGLHLAGNECNLDSKGFILPSPQTHLDQGHFFKRIIDSPQYTRSTRMNCWLCEDWSEVTFYWRPVISGKAVSEPIFLHLECDDFRPELMEYHAGVFRLTRAVPPGTLKFFFSYMTSPMNSKEYKTEILGEPFEIEIEYWQDCLVPIKMLGMNYINSTVDKHLYYKIETTRPRMPALMYTPPAEDLERIPWSLGISLFKDYRFTDHKLITECFELDWNMSRLPALVKIPLQQAQIKEILLENYENILETYKTLAAYGGSEVFSIGSNVFFDFLNECKLIDGLYGASDIGVNWNASVAPKDKGQLYNPGNSLVRYEFMEILVRVANDRYVRNKICGNLVDAVRKVFLEHFTQVMKVYTNSVWREAEYLVEEVDLVYKAHRPILDHLYKKYSGRKCVPGQKAFMSLEEFRELCRDARLTSEKGTVREIDLAFAVAMMTQMDEVYKKRHIEMSYVEFLEALARVCAQSGYAKKYPKNEKDEIKELYHSNVETKLHKKIEEIMPNLLKLCSQNLKENFVFPTPETYKRMMFRSNLSLNNLNSGFSALNTMKSE